jgi:L-aminopeptidase/D-esterase-like protein
MTDVVGVEVGVTTLIDGESVRTGVTAVLPIQGGNGTASRLVGYGRRTVTVAAFVQANFGLTRRIDHCRKACGPELIDDNPLAGDWFEVDLGIHPPPGTGSVIVVVATDAPLLPG